MIRVEGEREGGREGGGRAVGWVLWWKSVTDRDWSGRREGWRERGEEEVLGGAAL